MNKKIQHKELRGLPGGPNEMPVYVTGVFSTEGFRIDSPDVNNYENIIPSGSITMKERDGSPLRKGPIHGIDNLGNEQVMYPGYDYEFPGTEVKETLLAKMGGGLLDKTIKCGNCGWEWKAADGGSDIYNCHKCPGKGVVKAQPGYEVPKMYPAPSLELQKKIQSFVAQEDAKKKAIIKEQEELKKQVKDKPVIATLKPNYNNAFNTDISGPYGNGYTQEQQRYFESKNIPPHLWDSSEEKKQWDAEKKRLAEEAIVQRRKDVQQQAIKDLNAGNFTTARAENLGNAFRLFPEDADSFIDNYINPFQMVGSMAGNLGRHFASDAGPLDLKALALDVAAPLAVGAIGGLGAKSTGKFANNILNPLAGTGRYLTTKTPLKNAYKLNPLAAKEKDVDMLWRWEADQIPAALLAKNAVPSKYTGRWFQKGEPHEIIDYLRSRPGPGTLKGLALPKGVATLPSDAAKFTGSESLKNIERIVPSDALKNTTDFRLENNPFSEIDNPNFLEDFKYLNPLFNNAKIKPNWLDGYATKKLNVGDIANNLGGKYLPNAYKFNPFAFKPKSDAYYRQIGEPGYLNAIQEGKVLSKGQKEFLANNPEFNYWDEYNEYIDYANRNGGLYLRKPTTAPFFQKGELFFPPSNKTGFGRGKTAQSDVKYLLEGKLPDQAIIPRYRDQPLSKEVFYGPNGGTGVLDSRYSDLSNFEIYQQDWLRGYKKKQDGGEQEFVRPPDLPILPSDAGTFNNWLYEKADKRQKRLQAEFDVKDAADKEGRYINKAKYFDLLTTEFYGPDRPYEELTEDEQTNINNIHKNRKASIQNINLVSSDLSKYGIKAGYDPNLHTMYVPEVPTDRGVLSHEFSHMGDQAIFEEGVNPGVGTYFTEQLTNSIYPKQSPDFLNQPSSLKKNKTVGENIEEGFNEADYLQDPSEVKARLRALRDSSIQQGYKLLEPGYNINKYKEGFNKEEKKQYEQLKKSGLSDDKINEMMYLFAKNNQTQPTMGKNGVEVIAQNGGEETSWSDYLNPMNWGVSNRDDAGTFKQAFRAARIDGDSDFLYQGKRYSTELKATPSAPAKPKGITPELLIRQAYRESAFNPNAVSPAGYKGLGQIGDGVIKDYKKANNITGSVDPFNMKQNSEVQKYSMNELYNSSFINKPGQSEQVRLAKTLAAYNWGRTNVINLLNDLKEDGVDIYNSLDWISKLPDEPKKYINDILLQKNTTFNTDFSKALGNQKNLPIKRLYGFRDGGESKPGPLMQSYNRLPMEKKMGGAIVNKKQFGGQLNSGNITMYKDYIKGNIENETEAIKNYDKLNRIYYSKAKELGMSAANYIMTYIVGNS